MSFNAKAAKILSCDSCSTSVIEAKVRTQPIENRYFVIDFQTETIYYYDEFLFESYASDKDGSTFALKLTRLNIPPMSVLA
jgi:hypothetical protein